MNLVEAQTGTTVAKEHLLRLLLLLVKSMCSMEIYRMYGIIFIIPAREGEKKGLEDERGVLTSGIWRSGRIMKQCGH